MKLKKHEEEGISLIMQACKILGWVIAFPDAESNGIVSEVNHMVIGKENVVQSLVSEGAELYTIAVPPR